MKRVFFIGIAALAAAGCMVSELDGISVGTPGQAPVYTAFFADEDTKVYADSDLKLHWNAGDEISVLSVAGNQCYGFDGQTGDREGTFSPKSTPAGGTASSIYAVYPFSEGTNIDKQGAIQYSFPETQRYEAESFGPGANIMVAKADGDRLCFRNLGGCLRLKLYGSDLSVSSITLSAAGGEALAGQAALTVDSDEIPSAKFADGAPSTVTLVCPSPVALGTGSDAYTEFWFALPTVTLSQGFSISVSLSDGRSFSKLRPGACTIDRNKCYSMAPLEVVPEDGMVAVPDNEIWYTTTSGRAIQPTINDFGATMVSNTYSDGKGIMRFDGPVTRVPNRAFENYMESESTNLASIYLPGTVTSIGAAAFYRTEKLEYIQIPSGLSYIGHQAFMYTGLKELRIPDNAEFGGTVALLNPNLEAIYSKYATDDHRCLIRDGVLNSFAPAGLTEYPVPDGVVEIGDECFIGCRQLSVLILPGSVRTIGYSAIEDTGIVDMIVPEGVETIRDWAFRENANLRTITLPSTLSSIGSNVVGMCDNLEEFRGKYASSDGKGLVVNGELVSFARKGISVYTTPPEVTVIGADLFWDDDFLTDVTISEGVKEIKRGAFYACDNLESIYFPSTLETVGSRILSSAALATIRGPLASKDGKCFIFKGKLISVATTGMSEYTVPEGVSEIGAEAFLCAYSLKEITFPEGVTIIDENAIRMCSSLTTVTFPASLQSVGNHDDSQNELFYSCGALKRVFCKAPVPPGLKCTLLGNAVVYVPLASLDQYEKSAWGDYGVVGLDSFEKPDMYKSSDYSEDGRIVELQTATRGAGIDVYLMGDAFSDRQVADGTYEKVMKKACDALFSEEPYKSFRDCFTVRYAVAVSENEEVSAFSNTALGTYFGSGTFIGGDTNAIWRYTSWQTTGDALAIVIINADRYAGTCHMEYDYTGRDYGCGDAIAYVPFSSSDEGLRLVLLHEAGGHGFAKLDDEYSYGATITETQIVDKYENPFAGGWYKNTDVTNDPARIKWSLFLQDARYAAEGLGIFEGGGTYAHGVWRPTEDSIMNSTSGVFNAPSRYAIWYRIGKLAFGDDWNGTYEDFVSYDAVNRTPTAAQRRQKRNCVEKQLPPLAPPVIVANRWGEKLTR